MSLVGKEIW
jgi:cysteine protease ATG4